MALEQPALLAANRQFHRLRVGGVRVQFQCESGTSVATSRAWSTGSIPPPTIGWPSTSSSSKRPQHIRRPDLLPLVNSLPLVLPELENPADLNANLWKAYDKIQTHRAQVRDLLQYNELLVGASPRAASLAADLVVHFQVCDKARAVGDIGGKAMVLAMSRDICVHLHDQMIQLRIHLPDVDPERGAIKVVMNGFDARCVHTLYVDKPMKGHDLMQAITRVNRVFKDKQGSLVIDYIGIATELKTVMKAYTASQGRGQPTVDAHEACALQAEQLDVLRALLHGFDYSGFLSGGHKTLAGAANHVLGPKSEANRDGKRRFADTALAMSKAFTLCCMLDEDKTAREGVAFMQAVKVILTKKDITALKRSVEQRDLAIRQIIDSAVVSGCVVDNFDAVGLDKPNISLLDDDVLAQVKNLLEHNLAVELLERLLEGEIKSKLSGNLVQEKKFFEMLGHALKRYQNRAVETAREIEDMVELARKFHESASRGEAPGLSDDELRFHDTLTTPASAVRELSDETLKKISHELNENLRQNLSVDWLQREIVGARLRLMVKRIRRNCKYRPDAADGAMELVLAQVEALGESWV